MNIFVVDTDPRIAARHLVDRHVSKMIGESAQILSNCFSLEQLGREDCPRTQAGTVRKYSHPHHPCCKWIQKSQDNMKWVIEHARELEIERRARFGSEIPHFSLTFVEWCSNHIAESKVPQGILTPFAQVVPEDCVGDDPVAAYRKSYKIHKTHLHKWVRNKPDWID